ncbi:phosphoglycerate kinase [Methanocalculus chunghsingensis]|uniref:Phosphoglycerate kinase n=1 Tax=Methanocalculus chunghsingensis TaxID=156457 RepID=A0A8J7W721_9EURY|nr:phosphoglycerate kinase [Methanocalculus chunghsingensis]MBR1369554.1 phosphoglycerate kinase [Methanocalculus chunghsingensis]
MAFGTLQDVDIRGKTVLVRVDFNSPIDPTSEMILDDKRFREHIPTIRALEDGKVVIVTHQSRPGKKDFTTLASHAEKLERLIHRPVTYIDDIFGRTAHEAIRTMRAGEILMLENVRFNAEENLTMKPEDAAKTHLVRRLSEMGDLFVNDAFGTAHRSQPTVVGIPRVMKTVAGLLMEREITMLSKVSSGAPHPITFILGGTKVDDSIAVADHVLRNGIADRILAIGVVGNIFLAAEGRAIGEPSRQLIESLGYTGEIQKARDILAQYADQVLLPETVAVREKGERAEYPVSGIPQDTPILDLGSESVRSMVDQIRSSGTIVFNGPAGVFEDPDFAIGTYELVRAAAGVEFSVVGGGHTAAVIEKMGLESAYSHLSTGGGACIEFLTGKKLPAVAALEASWEYFGR